MIIESEGRVKIIGVFLDDKLNFTQHATQVINKAASQVNALRRISSMLDTSSKRKVVNSVVLSILQYSAVGWHECGIMNCRKNLVILKFCNETNLIIYFCMTYARRTKDEAFTHYSDAHHTVSWLDHGYTVNALNLIDSVIIIDKFIMSYHRPLAVHFNCDVGAVTIRQSNNLTEYVLQWALLNAASKCRYQSKIEESLHGIMFHRYITLY